MSGAVSLLVPINVSALCVGPLDSSAGMRFGKIAADFQQLETQPYLGASVVPQPFADEPAPAGIHLHWALPDALTQGDPGRADGMRVVPNRYLVVRLAVTNESPAQFESRAWVVESDHLWRSEDSAARLADPRNALSRSVPLVYPDIRDSATEPTVAYQGRVRPLDADWRDEQSRLRQPFTALGYGTEAYAAAYPHCRNVFGFFDPCNASGKAPDGLLAKHRYLSYLVVGWYSDAAADPVQLMAQRAQEIFIAAAKQGGLANTGEADLRNTSLAQALAEDYRWAYAPQDSTRGSGVHDDRVVHTRRPDRTLFVGQLTQLEWRPDLAHAARHDGPISVAMGTTVSEALSAMLASTQGQAAGQIEPLLNDMQLDLLSDYASAAGQASLADARHLRDFAPVPAGHAGARDSGRIWTIQRAGARDEAGVAQGSGDTTTGLALKLPKPLGRALQALNHAQTAYDELAAALATRRSQLFADWTAYLAAKDDDGKAYLAQEIKALEALARELGTAQGARDAARQAVDVLLRPAGDAGNAGAPAPVYELQSVVAPRFYQPNDPVILLSGVDPSTRYGGDGRLDPDKRLVCRLSDEITRPGRLRSLSQDQYAKLDAVSGRARWTDLIGQALPRAADLASLCVEACLLDPWLDIWLGGTSLQPCRTAYVAGDHDDFLGVAPSAIGRAVHVQPWIPLILQWQTSLVPFPHNAGAGAVAAFALSHGEPDIHYTGVHPGPSAPGLTHYEGTVTLTNQVQLNLTGQIERYLNSRPADAASDTPATQQLRQTLEAVQKLPFRMMAQSMDGLHRNMLMRNSSLQMPVLDPPKEAHRGKADLKYANAQALIFSAQVSQAVANERQAAQRDDLRQYQPLRAGLFKITRLRLIDAFGQIRDVIDPDPLRQGMLPPDRVVVAARLKAPAAWHETAAVLPLRIAQPARLSFRYRSAQRPALDAPVAQEMGSDAATSPIFGWILHNRFDQALALYDAEGRPIGAFSLNGPAWQDAPGPSRGVANPDLLALVQHLGGGWQAADRDGFKRTVLAPLIEAIDHAVADVDVDGDRQDRGLAVLIGRPLALVKADLRLDLYGSVAGDSRQPGRPPIDQSRDAFKESVARFKASEDGGYVERTRRASDLATVRFPVRLGDNAKVHDGLVGYFVQRVDPAATYQTFYAPTAVAGGAVSVVPPPLSGADCLSLAVADPVPATVVMLVDPRAPVHAATGILPVKRIALPPHQFAEAMQRIDATFLVAPVLGGAAGVALPVPAEAGHAWSWLARHADEVLFSASGAGVRKWTTQALVESPNTRAGSTATALRISEGWLHLYPEQPRPDAQQQPVRATVPTPHDVLIQPDATGDLQLAPETATLHGAQIAMAEVDDGRRFIGYWSDERDQVSWKVVAHGGYAVDIRYSAPFDSQFDIEVLDATGRPVWAQSYRAPGAGWEQIQRPQVVNWRDVCDWIYAVPLVWFGLDAGTFEVRIKPAHRLRVGKTSEVVEKPWSAVNLWSLALRKRVDAAGESIYLSAWYASLHGSRIRYRGIPRAIRPENTYIGDWTDPRDFATWRVKLGTGRWNVRLDKRHIGLGSADDAAAQLEVEVRRVAGAAVLASARIDFPFGQHRVHALVLVMDAAGECLVTLRLIQGAINLDAVVLESSAHVS